MTEKINIENKYVESEEVRQDVRPYESYYECMKKTFDLNEIKSVCDVGCATGHLLYFLKEKNNIDVVGYEYFDFHKNSEFCKPSIKDNIKIWDMRDPLPDTGEKYDIVNCTEVGEHIDKAYCDVLIENCKKLSNKYIIFTWSSHGGENERHVDGHLQHLNPLKKKEYMELMRSHGLKENMELTANFMVESRNKQHFYPWWTESFIIWEI